MTEACKACGEIWSRLFDHRPVVNGEIRFMLKEFEEKRGEQEFETLFKILEEVTDFKESKLVKLGKVSEENIETLNKKLLVAVELVDKIENVIAKDSKLREQEKFKKEKASKLAWEKYLEDYNFKKDRINNAFADKLQELKDFYTDLDHKLNQIN